MKWTSFTFILLFSIGSIQASENLSDPIEMFAEDDEMLALDSEIEALLEEDGLNREELSQQMSQDVPEFISDEKNSPKREQVSPAVILNNHIEHIPIEETESLGVEIDHMVAENEPLALSSPLNIIKEETAKSVQAIEINLREVFAGAPIIYTLLFLLSTVSVCVWLYSMMTIRSFKFLPPKLIKELRKKLTSNQFDEALDLCVKEKHFFCKMLASGILARKHGLSVMVETMKTEGKRSTVAFWQRIGILNEIAIIAPMIGLLGTVLGMFYAFYDLNRSMESVSLLFDGLGISVGTTVGGLVVAILAMILYALAKYRLIRILASVENEAQTFAALIDTRGPSISDK